MKKVGNYLLVSQIGEGQFGKVYKAKDQDTDEIYAVKAVKKEKVNSNTKLRKLFDTEMAVMSMIDHPNVLHLHEYLETGNNYYLVIQYCNSGDLEDHVKKNQYLGEEESVYFLMQIMNGFKELHKHKIMHRDFKLANIFLNDDNVVIGDFGFAKSGFEMAQTKLGSPITMAPELLNSNGKVSYTNKADLWSIGVCFFQMIFGKVPWDAKNLKDLKRLVKVQSGVNLAYPKEPEISKSCKDLLSRLLTFDPSERISWQDFFNHPIFDNEGEKKADMKSSVMFRNNEHKVSRMFEENKKARNKEVELIYPDEMKIQRQEKKPDPETEAKKIQRDMRRARARFTHEKKIIVFVMHTCRKLRNIAKQRAKLGEASCHFMYSALLLLRKGIIMNEIALNAILKKVNAFGLNNFDEFAGSEEGEQISKELTKDNKLYYTLLSHLQKKLKQEVAPGDPRAGLIVAMSNSSDVSLQLLKEEVNVESKECFVFYSQKARSLENSLRRELAIGMAHLYLSQNSEDKFSYKQEGGVSFDWNSFEKKLNMDFVHRCIESALKEL